MNSTFKFKLIQALNKKNGNKGFTLIELLVVVIIIGVLAAIALPNLLGQVAKGRQAEARTNLGTINRAQQANRLENATFTTVSNLPVTTTTTYYSSVVDGGTGNINQLGAAHHVQANTTYQNDIRDYGSAVGQTTAGVYSAVVCEQTAAPDVSVTLGSLTVVPGTPTAACITTLAKEIK
ncbi:MAG: prepilin-type N-terminal cleavage/methylation domain-containing protein [Microcystis sp. M048S1]|uniref:type IV pilin-like G/H family protein n=1 Tax=unclassified Microcystis TaxID=2643300 RepID=UPI001191AF8A|nr:MULTISPECIES: type IV pilin-like G/H family protein [unclassified Microcystis]MCA2902852.1 prepilin-type N-terminal cleavage/methylation domain-containing protein [Microcystis sp. M035S1]MCA2720260.1 prepilin-type N-terminal cleavage/methylation domain-containing protein [Microcystis sp. M176S2]MCA2726111.1 prepilin-type N-terminal cleavage/methylation domain-containing protein [Microcystis sp. M166S2]MCA2729898.1 prepilin-type N-terminal cleavage/methylation domain-containing protein [Micro